MALQHILRVRELLALEQPGHNQEDTRTGRRILARLLLAQEQLARSQAGRQTLEELLLAHHAHFSLEYGWGVPPAGPSPG